jgi:hypothetical protein
MRAHRLGLDLHDLLCELLFVETQTEQVPEVTQSTLDAIRDCFFLCLMTRSS